MYFLPSNMEFLKIAHVNEHILQGAVCIPDMPLELHRCGSSPSPPCRASQVYSLPVTLLPVLPLSGHCIICNITADIIAVINFI